MLEDLWQRVDAAGRERAAIDVSFETREGGSPGDDAFDADAHLAGLDALASLGVTWNAVGLPSDSFDHAMEAMGRYGEQILRAR